MTSTTEQAALSYLARGWSVIPMRSRDKRPAVRWQEFQHHPASEAEIKAWFARWPDANVGIVTGHVSRLVVIDIDPAHGGEDSLEQLETEHGPLPATLEAVTGGGGRHLYFLHPGGVVRNRVGLVHGIDVRGDGGCVVAPPSVHASGRRYTWTFPHDPEHMQPAPLPHWLLSMLTGGGRREAHPMDYWRRLIREGVPEGERNNTIASLAGHLLWHGVDAAVVTELLLTWNEQRCRPPLDADEVVKTVQSIARLHERDDPQMENDPG